MCISNWGGISHKMLTFHEHINLFSGKSGSGKSTVMDAIQVVLYGSFHQSFLNKAADDSKNKRSVLSYLRGAQKDGTSNREGQDFCSILSIEIEDTGRGTFACAGVVFEVRRNDTELKKYAFFSHAGRMPENEYLTEEGYPYALQDIRTLIEERSREGARFERGDINRVYTSAEAYRRSLYDVIFGYIDGHRFTTMEKSAIALQMSNGTGQFIRDYMFPKSESDAIGELSQQLGAYRDIKEKIDDMKQRIDLLQDIQDTWNQKLTTEADIEHLRLLLRGIELQDLTNKREVASVQKTQNLQEKGALEQKRDQLQTQKEAVEQEIIQMKADLQATDLGGRQNQLKELDKLSETLAYNSRDWRQILAGLNQWKENRTINDYISSEVAEQIDRLQSGTLTPEQIDALRGLLEHEKQYLEEQIEDNSQQLRKWREEQKEKRELIEDIKNNRKSYPPQLKKAKAMLQERLNSRIRRSPQIQVYVLADLFDVTQKEWKNAVEGRLGRLKYAMITEPEFAAEAAAIFRGMKQFENVDLIHSAAIAQSEPEAKKGSLYETVRAKYDFVDTCLRRYLGHIICCQDVEELTLVRDGVTRDCYSYSNFMFRHLKEKDYTVRACIGSVVSREKLADYEQELMILNEKTDRLASENNALKQAREYESLRRETSDILRLAQAGGELAQVNGQKEALQEQIRQLQQGEYAQLQTQLEQKEQELAGLQREYRGVESRLNQVLQNSGAIHSRLEDLNETMQRQSHGFAWSQELREEIEELLTHYSGLTIRNRTLTQMEDQEQKKQELQEKLVLVRNAFNTQYPSCGLNGLEQNNDAYDRLLADYRENYEPQYQTEFEKQCDFVYKSLRDNVIASIHGDIKAAKRHEYEINRLLKQTHFSDSIYQIEIQPANNANGQFYQMLMAEELDSKNLQTNELEGQISFGEEDFYRKYAAQIQLLTDKFMPVRDSEDEAVILQKKREMEQYADYRNYLSFRMYERVEEENGKIRKNYVDEMAGRDSGGEGQNPKYVALLAGFAMLYMQQNNHDSKIRLVLLDEAFSKMDQERSAVCLQYSRMMQLQLIVCVPDERLQSLIRNVDCVYGFRRHKNQISMMHIDKGNYLELLEG